jgi:ribosomal protein L32
VEQLKYRIVTTGEIHSGFSIQEVQKNLLGLCKDDKDKVERIFSGNLFVFESGIDLIAARRYKTSLDQAGIVCQIEPLTPLVRNQDAPTAAELSGCPKCGASSNGEEVCASCGIVPAKYLEKQRLEHQAAAVPAEERSAGRRMVILAMVLLFAVVLAAANYFLPKNIRYEITDWFEGLNTPNFDHPPNKFNGLTQADIIREYEGRGYKLDCYGNLHQDERVSKSDDYACWMPINSAYNNIPARMVTFFFSDGQLNHARIEFPYSSFEQVQEFLEKKLVSERRLDSLTQYRGHTDSYGEALKMWEVTDGYLKTSNKPTPGRSFILLWSRK